MAQADTTKLDRMDRFPRVTLTLVDGGSLIVPDSFKGSWCVFLAYRGYW